MRILIIGGSGSGKSRYSEELVTKFPQTRRIYFATMHPFDEEDQLRILKHQKQRAHLNFETIEAEDQLSRHECVNACVLVDSVTSLLSNSMFSTHQVDEQGIVADLIKIKCEVLILVSDFCFSEGIHDDFTETWKRKLGHVNQALAQKCDVVLYLNGGIAKCLKGEIK